MKEFEKQQDDLKNKIKTEFELSLSARIQAAAQVPEVIKPPSVQPNLSKKATRYSRRKTGEQMAQEQETSVFDQEQDPPKSPLKKSVTLLNRRKTLRPVQIAVATAQPVAVEPQRSFSEIDPSTLSNLIDQKMHVLMSQIGDQTKMLDQVNVTIKEAE